MKKISGYLTRSKLPDWSIPLGLLVICVLSYGLLINKLGFYQDDWHFIYYAYTQGTAGLANLLNYDGHPLAVPLYSASFQLLGFNPLYWQIFSLFWRWMAVVTFWLVLHRIWPTQRRITFTAAAIYTIYPLYSMQPMAVVYFEVWISHFILALSFLLTIEAIKQPRRFWVFTTLAIFLKILHMFSSEYTWGMELIRPIVIWLTLPALENENIRPRLVKMLQISAPYLIVFGMAIVWRGFLYHSPVLARSDPTMLDEIIANPFEGLGRLVSNSFADMILIMVGTWFQPLDPRLFSLTDKFNLQIILMLLVSTIVLAAFLYNLFSSENYTKPGTPHWLRGAFILSSAAVIFGMLPSYAAGYFVYLKLEPWNGRFVIGSMPGVALLTALILEWLINAPKKRFFITALLISLGIGWQIRSANSFRWAWDAETNFLSQLELRIPSIKQNTAFIADKEFLGLMGDYPTSFALNALYAAPGTVIQKEAKTWLFVMASNFNGRADNILSTKPFQASKHSTFFTGKRTDSLVIYFEPDLGQCLWIITPENADMPIVPGILKDVSQLTNTNVIFDSDNSSSLMGIMIPVKHDDWCAYYQRGSLANQMKKWSLAATLWLEAGKKGLHPTNGFEYLPFIESYAQTGDWGNAYELTKLSNRSSKGMEDVLCHVWTRLKGETDSSQPRVLAYSKIKDLLGCR